MLVLLNKDGLPGGPGRENENLTGVLVATMRDLSGQDPSAWLSDGLDLQEGAGFTTGSPPQPPTPAPRTNPEPPRGSSPQPPRHPHQARFPRTAQRPPGGQTAIGGEDPFTPDARAG